MKRRLTIRLSFICLAVAAAGPLLADHEWMCNSTTPYHWASTSVSIVPATEEIPAGAIARPEVDYHTAYDNAVLLWHSTTMNLSYSSGGNLSLFYDTYGVNGWLGLATIWQSNCVISMARSQLNDTYLGNTGTYSRTNVDHVACQEVGHTFGLDHNRTSNTTCMNDNILTAGTQINQHDRDTLDCIYTTGQPCDVNLPPVASFTWNNPYSTRVDFNASASSDPDGSIVSYLWDFGDSTTTTTMSPTVTHWYNVEMAYFVQLTVTDNEGATSTTYEGITLCDGGQIECQF
jgi:PKD repeat protein